MKKIGVVSDIHGSLTSLEKVFNDFKNLSVELVLVAGDILYHGPRNPIPEGYNPMGVADLINTAPFDFVFARGNCDADVDSLVIKYPILQEFAYIYVDGIKILLNHGDKIDDFEDFLSKFNNIDLFITGHTHIREIVETKFGTHLNPGSISLPKSGNNKSYALVVVEDGKFIIEFKEIL